MVLDRINRIKSNISIYTNKKTSNLLDGTYNSIFKGKSLNFEDLREYVIGDNVKDIDWKASARSGSLLIKQFIAERKHNIIIVFDASKKMSGDTIDNTPKKEIQIQSLGTVGYLAIKNGDYVSGIYSRDGFTYYSHFKSTLVNLEQILSTYENDAFSNSGTDSLTNSLEFIEKNINRKSIIFIATDIYGMSNVQERLLKVLSVRNNILFINVEDTELSGDKVLDLENDTIIPKMLLNNKKLIAIDKELKEKKKEESLDKLKKYGIPLVNVSGQKDVVPKIIELLEKHKYAK